MGRRRESRKIYEKSFVVYGKDWKFLAFPMSEREIAGEEPCLLFWETEITQRVNLVLVYLSRGGGAQVFHGRIR